MFKIGQAFILILIASFLALGQPLPQGKWILAEYRFESKTEHTVSGIATTLVVRPENRLGGDSGCNAYGGSYSNADGKLKIAEIISTMRACQEPTTALEKNFFDVLERADSDKVEGDALVIFAKDGRYLRFVRAGGEAN